MRRRHRTAVDRARGVMRALDRRRLPSEDVAPFLGELRNAIHEADRRGIATASAALLKYLEKKHGLVTPGHYRDEWMALGMVVFGLPIGSAMMAALGSSAYIGIGLPIGMAIGSAIGARKDAEARAAGRVLEIDGASDADDASAGDS